MNYLLDTHVFIWSILEKKKLSAKVIKVLENPDHHIFVSAVSFWEISLKFALGKLQIDGLLPNELPSLAHQIGFQLLDLNSKDTSSYHLLKSTWHKDPFDKMLIWQAIKQDFILVSKDENITKYANEGLRTLW